MRRTAAPPMSFLLLALLMTARVHAAPKTFEFADGDRVVLLGNEFVERDLDDQYIETQLLTRFPEKHLTFRNLGYAGDNVSADARNLCAGWENFGPPDQGFNRLKELVGHLKPTVIFVCYGMNESFEGEKGVQKFQVGLERLLDMLDSQTKARFVLVSPIRHETMAKPFPDGAEHNRNLSLYVAAMASVAGRHEFPFIDLFTQIGGGTRAESLGVFTRDGIHLTPYGYWRVAAAIEHGLGIPPRTWHIELAADGKPGKIEGAKLGDVKSTGEGLSFEVTDSVLPVAAFPVASSPAPVQDGSIMLPGSERLMRVTGLKPGRYTLKSGTETVGSGTAEQWAQGVSLHGGPEAARVEQLRHLIHAKSLDFFHYWRPENDTYILGYRKGEQGRNAVEIPQFEPLVAQKEAEIAKLCVPASTTYTLVAEH